MKRDTLLMKCALTLTLTLTLILSLLPALNLNAQSGDTKAQTDYMKKNHLFILLNNHFERRGSENWETSNPDFAFGYERDIIGFGRHRFYAGIRTGVYDEYVLTGNGWSHPVKTRFFLGLSPSYMFNINERLRVQLNLLHDVLFPNDYDEIWGYWAVEPSFQYFRKNFYAGISATSGVYPYFDPRAHMVKGGVKIGYRF